MTSLPDGHFTLDADRSRLGFRATAFLLMPVRGTLDVRAGGLQVAGGTMTATGVADARSVSTGIGLRDRHLRHAHYLGAADHPDVTLRVDGAPATTGAAEATLTVRGRDLRVPMTIERADAADGEVRLTARGTFDRTSLGMLPRVAGVSRLIRLELDLVFTAGA